MRLAYIAGPYRASTPNGVYENCQRARAVGVKYAKMGMFPVVPHMATQFMDGIQTDEFWLEGTMRLMDMCDVVVMMDTWKLSTGARAEHDRAIELGKEIIYEKTEETELEGR